jgi:hypothetical protein
MKENEVAVLVLTCDKYADIWPVFYSFFFKYWPACPYKIYNASNYQGFSHPKVSNMLSNQVSDWSTEVKAILKQIPEKYLIVLLEDYLIYKPVDENAVKETLSIMEENNALFLKLGCFPRKYNPLFEYDKLPGSALVGKIRNKQPFKINLQVGIWNKELLNGLLREGEDPWKFEVNGSERADEIPNPCLCFIEDPKKNYVHGPITYFCTALSRGVWMRDAIELCKKENIPVEIHNRKVETKFEFLYRQLYLKTPLSKRKYLDFIKSRFLNLQY